MTDTVSDYEKGPRAADYEKGDDTVSVTLAQWKALTDRCNGGATVGRLRPITYALLGFVREVRSMHQRRHRTARMAAYCAECSRHACGDVEWPCPTEQAARKWIGGEG